MTLEGQGQGEKSIPNGLARVSRQVEFTHWKPPKQHSEDSNHLINNLTPTFFHTKIYICFGINAVMMNSPFYCFLSFQMAFHYRYALLAKKIRKFKKQSKNPKKKTHTHTHNKSENYLLTNLQFHHKLEKIIGPRC
ncbi:LOW QUALITY PROTEIN: hypothetical protein PanWU01x14_044950 [Parasponia andersonii]|uniref:Uncharacterized protein n=1 Tax=Parasponia andersonii TaxID=3476 RepID=A0A2P5DPC9_PARAD|nr:LOW QUALITY PROTEIN: hypothetical protein PanWU01x14_044950 [Parasponia andersonii]